MEKIHDWQKEFKTKENLVQQDIAKFEQVLFDMDARLLGSSGAGAKLKAAIEAGWIENPVCEVGKFKNQKRWFYGDKNVDEMHPGAVRWLGQYIDEQYTKSTEIPKNL